MVDDGNVPKSIQKALKALESRGNPYGKLEKKRADWAKDKDFAADLRGQESSTATATAETLYFVDSITSYDDRMQAIGRATARILDARGEDFGILGAAEKDSGHEVRRFGEEMLFMALRDHNTEAIRASGVQADRHRRPARLQRAEARLQRYAAGRAHQPGDRARRSTPASSRFNAGRQSQQRLRLSRSLLSGPAQPDLRRAARCARCDSRPEASGDEPLPRPLVLLRRRRADAVLRAERRTAHGREAGADGRRGRRQRDRDRLPVLHGEYRRRDQGRGHGRKDDGHRPDGVGGPAAGRDRVPRGDRSGTQCRSQRCEC